MNDETYSTRQELEKIELKLKSLREEIEKSTKLINTILETVITLNDEYSSFTDNPYPTNMYVE